MLNNYTTYDSVRAVLGVTSRVFPDATLANEIFDLSLRAELATIGSTLDSDYLALLEATEALTATEQTLYNAVRLFSAHFVAFKSLAAMPELSPMLIGDSKATLKKDQAAVAGRITSDYLKFRSVLVAAYADSSGSAVPAPFQPNIALVSTPDFDPVTGA